MSVAIAEAFRWADSLADAVVGNASAWNEDAIESSLDSRDTYPFDSNWVRTNKELESHKMLLAPELRTEIDAFSNDLRERTFAAILRATGSSDLAGYVSDDFEMICSGIAAGYVNTFVFSLAASYVAGRIPDNSMEIVDGNPSRLY